MRIVVFQPPYPKLETPAAARSCIDWMLENFQSLKPNEQDLIVLPENANVPGINEPSALRQFAKEYGDVFIRKTALMAKQLNSLIITGIVTRDVSRWVNRTLVFDRKGKQVSFYDKLHLTGVEIDRLNLAPGSEVTIFENDGIRFGFAVCFDMYFPEYFATLAGHQVDIIICPSYQRSESAERICLISRARALDSGAYIIRSSYAMGSSKNGGHSLVASPDGSLLADAGAEPGIIRAEIDPKRKFVKPASYNQPPVEHRKLVETHRRPAVYPPRPEWEKKIMSAPFPRLCAHRGVSLACPENTLPAFGAAMALGVHEIEFDLWMSKDGVPVVCHDPDVERTTDGKGLIAEMKWDEISKLDAGIKCGEAWRGVRMPRFEEVIELTDGRVGLNIHIKEAGPEGRLVKLVGDILREQVLIHLAYIAGDAGSVLQTAMELFLEIPRACLMSQDGSMRQIELAKKYACRYVQFGRGVHEEEIRYAHDNGLICNLFWSDEPEDARNYVRQGIDIILTNSPQLLIVAGFPILRSNSLLRPEMRL